MVTETASTEPHSFGYKCFYLNKEWECRASSMVEAKQKATEYFKPSKARSHMVHCVLCEMPDGETVTHSPAEFG